MKKIDIRGILFLLLTTIVAGIQFPMSKDVLTVLDSFYITAIRFSIASGLFLLVLARAEGWHALRLDGRGWHLFLFGSIGFAGFSLFSFNAVRYTSAEHASIIMALMPLMTMLLRWVITGQKPTRFTFGCITVALGGVALVITKGNPASLMGSDAGIGDLLMLAAVACWVMYSFSAEKYRSWSPLRFTSLSCALGCVSILAVTLLATAFGFANVPGIGELRVVGWEMLYMSVLSAFIAALCWNAGLQRLGSVNGILFMNIVPVTVFAIGLAQGSHFEDAELLGALIVIGALVANNLHIRTPRPVPEKAHRLIPAIKPGAIQVSA